MRSYLVTLVYRLPAASGRRDAPALARDLGPAHVSSRWTDDTLELQVSAQALRPSDAVARAHRRVTTAWPDTGRATDPDRSTTGDLQEPPQLQSVSWQPLPHDGPPGLAGVHEPRRPAPPDGHLAAALPVPQDPLRY